MECGGVVGVGVRNSLRGGDQGVCPLVTLAQWNSSPCKGLLSYSWSTPPPQSSSSPDHLAGDTAVGQTEKMWS